MSNESLTDAVNRAPSVQAWTPQDGPVASITIVIAAKNCAERLEGTVLPWRALAAEIIVVDQMSSDETPIVAQKLGCRVIRNEPVGGNFDLNRKLGMQEAKSDWILYVDTDERPTPELLSEICEILTQKIDDTTPDGFKIPNMFYFLGRPLKHGLYNPRSAEIRMVRSGRWEYPCEKGFHHGLTVRGQVKTLRNQYKHFNVNSLSEWFLKTNQYTEHDAQRLFENGVPCRKYGAFWIALKFFFRHYFWKLGFLDGFPGLISIWYFMLYHLTLQVKLWELYNLRGLKEDRDFLKPIEMQKR